MILRLLVFLILILGLSAVSPAQQNHDTSVTYGTLIGAYGNANGIALVTDSMLNSDGSPYPFPGQKLLKLDDTTVCAIAGINGIWVPTEPEFESDVLGVIQDYWRSGLGTQPLARKMQGMVIALQFYLSTVVNVKYVTRLKPNISDYKLEVIFAGYDIDRLPKIGTFTITVMQDGLVTGNPLWNAFVTEPSMNIVKNELVYRTRGLNSIAEKALHSPDLNEFSGYSIITKYAKAIKADNGASLSLQDLDELGRTLVAITSDTFKREVGKNKQVAILKDGKVSDIDQPKFAQLRKPMHFLSMIGGSFSGGGIERNGVVGFFDSVEFIGKDYHNFRPPIEMEIDHAVFVNCHFKNYLLTYSGGPTYFDETNKLENVQVLLLPGSEKQPDFMRRILAMSYASRNIK